MNIPPSPIPVFNKTIFPLGNIGRGRERIYSMNNEPSSAVVVPMANNMSYKRERKHSLNNEYLPEPTESTIEPIVPIKPLPILKNKREHSGKPSSFLMKLKNLKKRPNLINKKTKSKLKKGHSRMITKSKRNSKKVGWLTKTGNTGNIGNINNEENNETMYKYGTLLPVPLESSMYLNLASKPILRKKNLTKTERSSYEIYNSLKKKYERFKMYLDKQKISPLDKKEQHVFNKMGIDLGIPIGISLNHIEYIFNIKYNNLIETYKSGGDISNLVTLI